MLNRNGGGIVSSSGQVSREAGFSKRVEVGQYVVTRSPVKSMKTFGITTTCQKYTTMRDDFTAEAKGVRADNTIFGPTLR